ncbi:MAG: hypothetical protein IT306_10810 [Chloroflexi bacterium]|nr:hypothetical protein [Chloroflexota bacterium]
MSGPPLFAQLAARFGAQPERLAVESLAFLLSGSGAVRAAVGDLCTIAAPQLASVSQGLRFGSRPDADERRQAGPVGLDRHGAARVIVDGRFWSALPADQPVSALRQLAPHVESALLILAPPERFTALWAEVRRRCRLAGLPVHGDHAIGDPIRWTRVGERQTVILTSWSAVLAGARTRLQAAGDADTLAEIEQLAGLCAQLDGEAFMPLGIDELSSTVARRLSQLAGLVEQLAQNCQGSGLCLSAEPDGHAEPGHLGYRLRFSGVSLVVCFSVSRWAALRETPFWLLVYDADGRPARGVEARLGALASEIPPRLLRDAESDAPLVPLIPPVGVDREAVLSELERQVEAVARLLGEGPTTGFGSAG